MSSETMAWLALGFSFASLIVEIWTWWRFGR